MDALAKVGAWSLLGVAVLWVFTALPNSAGMLEIAQGATFLGGLALAGAARNSSFREKVAEEIRTKSVFFLINGLDALVIWPLDQSMFTPAENWFTSAPHYLGPSIPKHLSQAGTVGWDIRKDQRGVGRQKGGAGTAPQEKQAAGSKGDPGPERPSDTEFCGSLQGAKAAGDYSLKLIDVYDLAGIFGCHFHTLQNQYTNNPELFPPAIKLPGCRGPRWTPEAIKAWFESAPPHRPIPPELKKPRGMTGGRGRGRPRIALQSKGGTI